MLGAQTDPLQLHSLFIFANGRTLAPCEKGGDGHKKMFKDLTHILSQIRTGKKA